MKTTTSTAAAPQLLSLELRHRARIERDPVFDGRFFFAVTTTGIYCRPVCPARRALAKNVSYFDSAASAAAAGFRPCLRCRPEQAPAATDVGHAVVEGALERIDEGILDGGSVADLAFVTGVGERRLRRLFDRTLGASPAKVALHRRLLMARQMLEATDAPVIDVAFASGFNSLRRFNEACKEAFGVPPTGLRTNASVPSGADLSLRLGVRSPFDGGGLLRFLAVRSIPGVEQVTFNDDGSGRYTRTFRLGSDTGVLTVIVENAESGVAATLPLEIRFAQRSERLPSVLPLVDRVKHIFDLAFDPRWIEDFANDPLLALAYEKSPGIRVPGCLDPFELSVRAVLGQQVTVAGATTLSGRVAQRWGRSLSSQDQELMPTVDIDEPCLLFPTPEMVVDQPLEEIGLPKARAETLRAVARLAIQEPDLFSRDQELADFERRFCVLPGIGPWTANYVAMRALHARDAFLAGDLVLRKRLAQGSETLPSAKMVEGQSEAWRPFRAYAGMLLWRS